MFAAGIITEYNPLHEGHVRLIREIRSALGPETAVVCCMSGDFVQRGEPAVVRRMARAKAAILSGADLALELPLPWAVSSAEGFAQGAVSILNAAGVVDWLVFGSECGSADAILRTAELLLDPLFPPLLREELARGDTFPAARQRAAVRLANLRGVGQALAEEMRQSSAETDSDAASGIAEILSRPNDTLAVEYCKALLRSHSSIRPMAVRRTGTPHDGPLMPGAYPSASALRALLRQGETDAALTRMAPPMADFFREEMAAGRAPVFLETAERAVLARLRTMSREDFAALDSGHEGVGYRLYRASREASSVREILEAAKTRRYPLARLRRMVLWAWLGLTPCPVEVSEDSSHPLASAQQEPFESAQQEPFASAQQEPFASAQQEPHASARQNPHTPAQQNPHASARQNFFAPSQQHPPRAASAQQDTPSDASAPGTAFCPPPFCPPPFCPPPYLRPLAASPAGQRLLARMRSAASLPVLTRPKDVKKLGPAACELFTLEARAADLYALAYPDLSAARGGSLWREGMPPPLSRA